MRLRDQDGSALAEAAIVFPCLVLLVFWSAGLTDVLILELKAAEAARFALWESTVFKPPAQIDAEVGTRFADLASPRDVRLRHTGLLLYPRPGDLRWRAEVDTNAAAPLGGTATSPSRDGPWAAFISALSGALPHGVDAAFRVMGFDARGVALARAGLRARQGATSPILRGGDLPGLRLGDDLRAPSSLRDLTLESPPRSQRPLRLVFDTWKAWPKAGAGLGTPPSRTYPAVEGQVSAQVGHIAFLGAQRIPGFSALNDVAAQVARSGLTKAVAGGTLPDLFSSGRMDDMRGNRGPITILPPERAIESWVPHRCAIAGAEIDCPTRRAGDVVTGRALTLPLDDSGTLGFPVDRPRYTLPYRISSVYWNRYGGLDRDLQSAKLVAVPRKLAEENGYVQSYACRGHFFGGSRKAQQPDRFGSCR